MGAAKAAINHFVLWKILGQSFPHPDAGAADKEDGIPGRGIGFIRSFKGLDFFLPFGGVEFFLRVQILAESKKQQGGGTLSKFHKFI